MSNEQGHANEPNGGRDPKARKGSWIDWPWSRLRRALKRRFSARVAGVAGAALVATVVLGTPFWAGNAKDA